MALDGTELNIFFLCKLLEEFGSITAQQPIFKRVFQVLKVNMLYITLITLEEEAK